MENIYSASHIHTCPVCDRDHLCYGIGCTKIDCLCDECSDADDDELHVREGEESDKKSKVTPPPELLEKFIALADAPSSRISKFAARYGRLTIFSVPRDVDDFKHEYTEYCDVWRYFARSMRALLRIASQFHSGTEDSKEDWDAVANLPSAIHEKLRIGDQDWEGDAELDWRNFVTMTAYHRWPPSLGRDWLVYGLNSLLKLGRVRPWLNWPAGRNVPHLIFNSPGLFAHLALQLCLRVTKREAFVICHHCHNEFTPLERAPKAGQRSFCPECRKAGEPKRYALQDYRERKRR